MALIKFEGRWVPAEARIAANSLDINIGDLVSETSGFMVKAGTTGEIKWISLSKYTFASNNQTVAKRKVTFVPKTTDLILEMTADASIAQADVGSYFNINADGTVDVATKSATKSIVNTSDTGAATDPVVTKQLELVRVISSTVWEFKIV